MSAVVIQFESNLLNNYPISIAGKLFWMRNRPKAANDIQLGETAAETSANVQAVYDALEAGLQADRCGQKIITVRV